MNQGVFADDQVELWMDEVEAYSYLGLALFSSDPMAVGDFTTVEVIGGSYARQQGVWLRSSIRALTLNAGVAFRSLPPGAVVAAVGVVTDPTAGILVARSMLLDGVGDPAPISYPTGGTYTISTGQYVIGLDVV